ASGTPGDVAIQLRVGSLEPSVRIHRRPAMAGAGDEEHRFIALDDDTVQVCIDEIEPRNRAEVTQQSWLDVLTTQRSGQHRIVLQIDLSDAQVIRCTPPAID